MEQALEESWMRALSLQDQKELAPSCRWDRIVPLDDHGPASGRASVVAVLRNGRCEASLTRFVQNGVASNLAKLTGSLKARAPIRHRPIRLIAIIAINCIVGSDGIRAQLRKKRRTKTRAIGAGQLPVGG
jgi:hypothetical protein